MSSVLYSLNHKGVKLIPAEKAWVKGKNGKLKLNSYNAYSKKEKSRGDTSAQENNSLRCGSVYAD